MEKLKALRERKGLSQVKLAQRADMNPATVWRIETGQRSPTVEQLGRLAEALDLEVSDFFPKDQARLPLQDRPRDAGRQLAKLLQEARALRADEHIETAAAALDRILSERVPTAEEGLFDLIEAVLEENEHLKTRISELEAA